jgi:hypothetical protein
VSTATDIGDLRRKYAEIVRLRSADAEAAAPRAAMAALAREFPGALRETDELPMDELERRLEELDAAFADPARARRWIATMARFHALARGALAAKRWLAGRRVVTAEVREAFCAEVASFEHAVEAAAWASELDRLASPSRGRVSAVVFERLAGELGVSVAEARREVFG